MSTRLTDAPTELDLEPNDGSQPIDTWPRHDPRTSDPDELPEVDWQGVQEWICGIAASWRSAESWYVIDWGDGTGEISHPALRIRSHIYSTRSACDNLTNTVTIRPLYRDGTTGPAVARSVVQARGWGAPQHRFSVYSDPSRVFAELFRTETPLAYGVAWDPDTAITQLADGESRADHTYAAGPARTPLIGVLDRPARRLRWFSGPLINSKKIHPGSALTAWFGLGTEWDGGYSGDFHVTNHTETPLRWQIEFGLDEPGVLREVWPAPTTHLHQLPSGRWRIHSTVPIPANADARIGARIEPAGDPTKWPLDLTAEPRPQQEETTTEDEA